MPRVQMISSTLVAAIGRYSCQLPVNRIARLSSAAAEVNTSMVIGSQLPRAARKLQWESRSWQGMKAGAVEGAVPRRYMRAEMTKMFKIALPDGSVKEMPEGSTPADVAAAIGPGLAKAALAAKINGEVRDIMRPFEGDAQLALITSRDEAEALELVRHDYAHILAEA